MSERSQIQEPGELVYPSSPSWAPAFFALGAALAVIGTFVDDSFMLPGWVYSLIGAVVLLAALRSMISGAVSGFYRLPRKQRARGAVLPARRLEPPRG